LVQFSDDFLDDFIAPELSALTQIVEIEEVTAQIDLIAFSLRQAVGPNRFYPRDRRHLALLMRRASVARETFNLGIKSLAAYITALPEQHFPEKYFVALSQLELAALHAFAAIDGFDRLAQALEVGMPTFNDEDGALPRLKKLANRVRHAQEDAFLDDEAVTASIWLTRDAIKWAQPRKPPTFLLYSELGEAITAGIGAINYFAQLQ
jgi:hypothetical protein